MNTNSQIDKIDKVLSKISGKEMKAFVWQYAATHEDFATALVEKYWKPERGNYKEQVEAETVQAFPERCVESLS